LLKHIYLAPFPRYYQVAVYLTTNDLDKSSPLTIKFKSQAGCAVRYICEHIVVKRAVFPELWILQGFQTAKVTFINHAIQQAIHDFLLVFHCNYCNSIFHHFRDIIDYFPKHKEVT